MALVRGTDVSGHQPNIMWSKVAKDVGFVIIKATQGQHTESDEFDRQWRGAHKAGVLTGTYHFAGWGNSVTGPLGDAKTEARNYVDVLQDAGWKSGRDLPPCLDIERTGGKSKGALTSWALTFVQEVDRLLKLDEPWLKCGFYCNRDFYNNRMDGRAVHNGRWLWLAVWPHGNWPTAESSMPSGAAIWQWTDRATVDGIGRCDGDVARLNDLKRLAPRFFAPAPEAGSGGGPAPQPEQEDDDMPSKPLQLVRVKGEPAIYAVACVRGQVRGVHVQNPTCLKLGQKSGFYSDDIEEISRAELKELLEREPA